MLFDSRISTESDSPASLRTPALTFRHIFDKSTPGTSSISCSRAGISSNTNEMLFDSVARCNVVSSFSFVVHRLFMVVVVPRSVLAVSMLVTGFYKSESTSIFFMLQHYHRIFQAEFSYR